MTAKLDESYFNTDTPLEEPVRYYHEGCESSSKSYTDKALVVIRNHKGWGYRCHRCGLSGFRPYKHLSPSQMSSLLDQTNRAGTSRLLESSLPLDFTTELPPLAQAWLYTCLLPEEIVEYGIGWSPGQERIIFPVYQNRTLVGYCGRSLKDGPGVPKYKTLSFSIERIFFTVDRDSNHVVFVEDILSAIVVGRVASSVALLGCFVPPVLLRRYDDREIHIWLDSNKLTESLRFRNRYSSLGYDVRSILSIQDPKYQSEADIKSFIGLGK